jgi:serine/threonine protein kinase
MPPIMTTTPPESQIASPLGANAPRVPGCRVERLAHSSPTVAVFQGVQEVIERPATIEIFYHEVAPHDEEGQKALEQFRSEARVLASIGPHPNIPSARHFLEDERGRPCLILERVPSATLGERLRDFKDRGGKPPLETALDWAIQIVRGFEHAHSKGVIHPGPSSATVRVSKKGKIKLRGFGSDPWASMGTAAEGSAGADARHCASPEKIADKPMDERSDVYSVSVLLYWIFCGRLPFDDPNIFGLMAKHMNESPRPPRQIDGNLPAGIEKALLKGLEKKPEARFQTMAELRAALEAVSSEAD